jgi:signal transduction histidine kinase
MKVINKIRMIFLPAIVLPLVLIVISLAILGFSYTRSAYSTGIGISTIDSFMNTTQTMNALTSDTFEEIQRIARESPESFENQDYINRVNESLLEKDSYLIIRKDDKLIYRGTDVKHDKIESMLPAYGSSVSSEGSGILIGNPENFLIKQQDFIFSDSSKGSIFIMTNLENIKPMIRKIILRLIISVILILFMTSSLLTWYMYYEFVRPINLLKDGTDRIREGDLDTDVEILNQDEIGDLCASFNEMRAELKKSINDRLRYEEETRELISNISHDLKTPLTAIKGYSEAIIDGVADTPEKMERYMKTIYNKANDMDVLLNELSIASKIDCNTVPYNFVKINIEAYFRDCMDEIGSDLEQRNMDFAFFNYCDGTCIVMADPEQLKRVIMNIINNACKYSGNKGKGHVNIRLKEMENYVQVEIEDDGIGISAKDLPNIFNRLYRADASRASSGGSGLGLSISKKIIEDHGGHIWASSKLNTGTTIYFTLNKISEEDEEYE